MLSVVIACDELKVLYSNSGVYHQHVCYRMAVILKEESITLYKDKNIFTAVVFAPGSSVAFGQVLFMFGLTW